MSSITLVVNYLNAVLFKFGDYFFGQRDKRTADFFLAEKPLPLYTILTVYLIFCLYLGPRFMRDRKPFGLKKTLLAYNAIQVVLSIVLSYEMLKGGWGGRYSYKCQPVPYDTDATSMRMARAVWLYYIAKLTELFDTVFFVLRKRNRQVSVLHIYHHTSMPLATYAAVQYLAGGHGTLVCLINSLVHVVMYSYYLLAAMGPKVQKYLWWKKYITVMQIIQFVIVFFHNFQVLFQPDCGYSKGTAFMLSLNALLFVYMFSSFYIENYKKDQKKNAAALKQD